MFSNNFENRTILKSDTEQKNEIFVILRVIGRKCYSPDLYLSDIAWIPAS